MRHTKMLRTWFLLPVVTVLLSSCIRDEIAECPPMQLTVAVKDKNYFNAAAVAAQGLITPVDENLPFRSYISTLYYKVTDDDGNTVAEQTNTPVSGDELTYPITLPQSLPYGRYHITLWGNMKSDRPLTDDATQADLESDDAARNDIYLGAADFDYSYGAEQKTVEMERAKGRLIIVAEGLPANINLSEKTVADVYSIVTRGFVYSGLTDLNSTTPWMQPGGIITHTLTGPSEGKETSLLSVDFLDADSVAAALTPEDVKITMGRNEITVVRYVYEQSGEPGDPDNPDTPEGIFKIYLLVGNDWAAVHNMVVN